MRATSFGAKRTSAKGSISAKRHFRTHAPQQQQLYSITSSASSGHQLQTYVVV
jgi:hypothetical protein